MQIASPVCALLDAATFHAQRDLSLLGELDRIAEQIHQHLAQLAFIRPHIGWNIRGKLQADSHIFVGRAEGKNLLQAFEHVVQVEVFWIQRGAAGFDLRHFQYVIDQSQQVLAAGMDDLHVFALVACQAIVAAHDLGEAQDGIQRRTELMAHICQEGTFRLVGSLGGLFGLLQFDHRLAKLLGAFGDLDFELLSLAFDQRGSAAPQRRKSNRPPPRPPAGGTTSVCQKGGGMTILSVAPCSFHDAVAVGGLDTKSIARRAGRWCMRQSGDYQRSSTLRRDSPS